MFVWAVTIYLAAPISWMGTELPKAIFEIRLDILDNILQYSDSLPDRIIFNAGIRMGCINGIRLGFVVSIVMYDPT